MPEIRNGDVSLAYDKAFLYKYGQYIFIGILLTPTLTLLNNSLAETMLKENIFPFSLFLLLKIPRE